MAPFAVLDLSGLNRPSATASILRFMKRSTEFGTDTGASSLSQLAQMIGFRVACFEPSVRAGEKDLMKVLTKKSQETQAVLFGTTFVGRIHTPAENQSAFSKGLKSCTCLDRQFEHTT
jgi:hypothetical protein